MAKAFVHEAEITIDRYGVEGLRCAGKILRTLKPAPNKCELTVWNLAPGTRKEIEELRTSERGIPVKIKIGYTGQLTQVWLGDLRTAISVREPPDWKTLLSSGDGEKAHRESRIAQSFGPGTTLDTALRAVVKVLQKNLAGGDKRIQRQVDALISSVKMKGVGKILASGIVLHGSAPKVLTDLCNSAGLEWSIQDSQIVILNRGDALKNTAILVEGDASTAEDAERGGTNLIGSPDVDAEGVVSFRMLISPDAIPGSLVQLRSERVSGLHRIEKTTTEFDTHMPDMWQISVEAQRYG